MAAILFLLPCLSLTFLFACYMIMILCFWIRANSLFPLVSPGHVMGLIPYHYCCVMGFHEANIADLVIEAVLLWCLIKLFFCIFRIHDHELIDFSESPRGETEAFLLPRRFLLLFSAR